MWIGSIAQARFLERYRQAKKYFVIYCFEIPSDKVIKIGRSARLRYRLSNLRASVYRDHVVHVIHCSSATESLALDRYLKRHMLPQLVMGEWYSCTISDIAEALERSDDFRHLSISQENEQQPALFKPDTRPRPHFDVVIS